MKKSILITTLTILSLAGLGASAHAATREASSGYTSPQDRQEHRDRRHGRDHSDYRQVRAELHQLNIMFSRVNAQLRTFGAGHQIRREYSRLLRDRDRLNHELSRRNPDPFRVRMQIDRVRDQLREIEVRLRYRGGRHYRGR